MTDASMPAIRKVSRSFAFLNFCILFGFFTLPWVAAALSSEGWDAWKYVLETLVSGFVVSLFIAWLIYFYARSSVQNALRDEEDFWKASFLRKMWMVWRALGK